MCALEDEEAIWFVYVTVTSGQDVRSRLDMRLVDTGSIVLTPPCVFVAKLQGLTSSGSKDKCERLE